MHSKLFDGVLRGLPHTDPDKWRMPDARWADPTTLVSSPAYTYSLARPEEKLFLGSVGDTLVGVSDNRHALLSGSTRAGKFISVIAPNLLNYSGSTFVIDPKGEAALLTAQRRRQMGQEIHIFDPFGRIAASAKADATLREMARASYWNPVSLLVPDDFSADAATGHILTARLSPSLISDVGLLADSFVVAEANSENVHWDESSKSLIAAGLAYTATSPWMPAEDRHLITLRRLLLLGERMTDPETGETTEGLTELFTAFADAGRRWENFAATLAADPAQQAIALALAAFLRGASVDLQGRGEELPSVLSFARRHTAFLDLPELRTVLCGGEGRRPLDLALLRHAEKKISVFLCLPVGRLSACNRWLRMITTFALELAERASESVPPSVPQTLFLLDEFPVMGYMKNIEDAIGAIAGFGVKLFLVVQDLNQLRAIYRDRWESMIGNCGVMQFFAPNDTFTLKYLEERLGVTTVLQSVTGAGAQSSETNWRTQTHHICPLMTAFEIARVFRRRDRTGAGRQLVLIAGQRPLITEKVSYLSTQWTLPPAS